MNANQVVDWAEHIVAAQDAGLVTKWAGAQVTMADAAEINAIMTYRLITGRADDDQFYAAS